MKSLDEQVHCPLARACIGSCLPLVLVLAASACGDDGSAHHHTDGAPVDCSIETRADTYVAGLSKVGAGGYEFVLVESVPAPPAKNDNTWTVELRDGAGATVDGATMTAVPFMPDHGHGTPITAEVTAQGSGRYQIAPVNLWMPGLWETTVAVDIQGVTDEVVFAFCIDG